MILVIGTPQHDHPAHIFEQLKLRGAKPIYFQPWLYPAKWRVTFNVDNPLQGTFRPSLDHPPFSLSDIRSVYCRYTLDFIDPSIVNIPNPELKETILRETRSALGSLFRNLDCLWVDPVDSFDQHLYKAHQYKLLKAAGIRVPDTIISNDPDEVKAFYEKHQRQVVFKPCWFGAYTQKLTDQELTPEKMNSLSQAPVNFQEYIPGTDIIVYLVGEEPFAAEILSDTLDFRHAKEIKYRKIELPEAVIQSCRTLARTLNVNFPAIDLRRTPDGEYVFFEGNPNPVFLYFERETGYPVTDRLVKLLMAGNTHQNQLISAGLEH